MGQQFANNIINEYGTMIRCVLIIDILKGSDNTEIQGCGTVIGGIKMKYEFKMIIEDNIEFKILFDSEEEFENAVESLKRLANRYRLISIKDALVQFWDSSDESRTLSDQIQDTTHRLAICLIDAYPDSKPTSLISQEVGMTKGATSNNLTGKRGGSGNLFRRIDDGWTLSDEGLRIVISEILPEYQQDS